MKIAENYFRLGTENSFIILAKAKKLESEGREIINLGIGQPDFLTPKHIVEAAKTALDEWSSWIYTCEWNDRITRGCKQTYKKNVRSRH